MKLTNFKPHPKLFNILVIALLLISAGAAGFFYYKYNQTKGLTITENEASRTIDDVRKHLMLPDVEIPTIATVTDKTLLQDQAFFKQAENGDKVLIYQESKKAILYRPSLDRIVDVAPIQTVDAEQPEETFVLGETDEQGDIEAVEEIVSVAILNGSTVDNAAANTEDVIVESIDNVEIASKANAARSDYSENQIVILDDAAQNTAQSIQELIGGQITTSLPDGESTPENANIVVLLGNTESTEE